MEPLLAQWEAASPKVRLRRLPLALWDDFIILQDLYFAIGRAIASVVFHAVQRERRRLKTEDQIGDFVASHRVDRRFILNLNSDAVAAKSAQATDLALLRG